MSITSLEDHRGISVAGEVVARTLKAMRQHAAPGMSARELDEYGGHLLKTAGAQSAPRLTYGFPGWTCISVNEEIAHGIPGPEKIFREGDLINIDVSAEVNGYWADNGGSFVLGRDLHGHQRLVDASKAILQQAISQIRGGMAISSIGRLIETAAHRAGYKVIRNLCGHGIGRGLHEEPHEIANYFDRSNKSRFRKNTVVAVETFIATRSTFARQSTDGWTLYGNRGGVVAQHEHTLLVTDGEPHIYTHANAIWDD